MSVGSHGKLAVGAYSRGRLIRGGWEFEDLRYFTQGLSSILKEQVGLLR